MTGLTVDEVLGRGWTQISGWAGLSVVVLEAGAVLLARIAIVALWGTCAVAARGVRY